MDRVASLLKKHKVRNYGFLISLILIEFFYVIIQINPKNESDKKKWINLYQYLSAEESVYNIPTEELSLRMVYDVKTDRLYESYASDSNGYYYVTESKNSSEGTMYLGIYVSNDFVFAYPSVTGKGYVREMSEDEKESFEIFMEGKGIGHENLCYLTIIPAKTTKLILRRLTDVGTFIILAFVVFTIVVILWMRTPERSIRRTMKHYEVTEAVIEREWDTLKNVKDALYFTNHYIMWFKDKAFVIPLDRLVWTYVVPNKGAALDKLSHLKIVTRDKKKFDVALESLNDLSFMLCEITKRCPYVIFGYNSELKKMSRKDFKSMIKIVEDNRLSQWGFK